MDQEAPPRASGVPFLLAAVVFCASVVGVFWYQVNSSKTSAAVDAQGFDVAQVAERAPQAAAAQQQQQRSGLGMIAADPRLRFGQEAQQPAAQAAANPVSIAALVRATEAKIVAVAMDYTRRYPVIRQYGQDWMRRPDLRKLNDDYMRTHDPFAFIKGLAAAPSFGGIVRKYSTEPPIRNFVMDTIKTAPPEAMPTVLDYVNKNDQLKGLTDNVAKNLGLPPGLLGNMAGDGSKIDGNKVLQNVVGSDPQLQNALEQQKPR